MQTTQNPTAATQPGFAPIPTRIRDVAPLIIEPESKIDPSTREEIVSNLTVMGANLAGVHRTTAEAFLSQDLYKEAIPHLECAVKLEPDNIEYWNQLGFVAYLAGSDELAIQAFQGVIGRDAKQPDAIYNLGMVLFSKSMFTQAENCFAAYLELNPQDSQGWNNRGVCFHQIGKLDEARQCFTQALQINPGDSDAQFNLQSI